MQRSCWAVYYHSLSTDENQQHHCCPEGAESWCKYQCALATHEDVLPHTLKIAEDLATFIEPIFRDLCSDSLLEKRLLGATQNRNELFNGLVWTRTLKIEYVTRPTITVAVAQSVFLFNSGSVALLPILERLGIKPGLICISHYEQDRIRMLHAQKEEDVRAKKRRKSKQTAKKSTEEAHVEQEGV